MVAFVRGTLEYDAGRYAEAVPPLLEAREAYAQRSSQPRDLYFMLGDALARLDRYREAEPYLLQEIRLYPQHVRARAALAMLYQAAGREADAERVLNSLVLESADARRLRHRGERSADVRAGGRARRPSTPRRAPDFGPGHDAEAPAASRCSRLSRSRLASRHGGRRARAASASCRVPIATSSSSPSTRSAPTRWRRTAAPRRTPRLDALAARGARFTFAHAHAVVTLPSHASLLTGTYPYAMACATTTAIACAATSRRWRRG